MLTLKANELRRGDMVLAGAYDAPKEVVRVSSEPVTVMIDGRMQTISVTEIRFADRTGVIQSPTDMMPVLTRFGMASDA